MNRLKDYLGFAVQFVGLGYIVLWPASTPGNGEMFGAGVLCGGRVADLLDLVCRMPHPLHLGIGLHAAGALCAVLAVSYLIVRAAGRLRRRGAAATETAPSPAPATVSVAAKSRPRTRRPMPPPRRLARPRSHFGLRGLPQ